MHLAINVGHGYTKALADTGARLRVPSLLAPAPAALELGPHGRTQAVAVDDRAYLVGDPARGRAQPLWTRAKAADPDTLTLIGAVGAAVEAEGPVALAVGLPLSWYGRERRALREALVGRAWRVRSPDAPARRWWGDRVVVVPQGVGAAIAALGPGSPPGSHVIIDVGYRTTDYLVVDWTAAGPQADPTRAGSLEQGLRPVLDAAARQIAGAVQAALGPAYDWAAGVLLAGGGALALAPHWPGRATVVPEPQWANAVGFLAALG